MSADVLERLDAVQAFLPRQRYEELAGDHVPFDELNGTAETERKLARLIKADEGLIFVVGPSGAGKSSLIETHDEQTSVGSICPRPYSSRGPR